MKYSIDALNLDNPGKKRLATGENYGILLVTRGVAFISRRFRIGIDDMLICKPRQVLSLEYTDDRFPLSALWIRISPKLMDICSTQRTDIVESFSVNPEPVIRIRGQSQTLSLIKSLSAQMIAVTREPDRYAADLLEESSIKMFLALVIRACIQSDLHRVHRSGHLAIDEVFRYIHSHLTEELTLEQLEQEFFVSRHHLIRQFKRRCGLTIHQYIVKARLDLCREYIEQGHSITEVYRMGGFGGYNHFFRAFKQEYGMTPKEYYHTVYPNLDRAAATQTASQKMPDC